MIVAKLTRDDGRRIVSLHVGGHAGAGPYGADPVCAGASMLAYTIAQNVRIALERGLIKPNPKIDLSRNGKAIITCRAVSEEAYDDIVRTFEVIGIGYVMLAHNFPGFVACEYFETQA